MPEGVWFVGPGRVEIRGEREQALGRADVRVRSVVSGISAGSELLVYRGEAPRDLPPDLPTIGGDFHFPVKFGYASVGQIVEAGPDVTDRAPGDNVFTLHPHQTEFVVAADATVRLPPEVPPEVAVFTANLETALTVVLDAHPRLSESVLVTGQGVVGLLITMLLRRAGAGLVVAVDPLPMRRAAASAAGADYVLTTDDDVPGRLRELTAVRGADLAIEASGSPAALQDCVDAVAFGGTIVVASWYGTRHAPLALGGAFHRKRLRLVSSQVSTLDPALAGRWDRDRRTQAVTDLLCELPLAGLVTHHFPFAQAAAAYELLDHRPDECLQVVLDYV